MLASAGHTAGHTAAAIAVLVLAACAVEPGSAATIKYIGDVHDVIEGRVSASVRHHRLRAHPYFAGFEIGTATRMEATGEMMMYGGTAFTRSTDKEASNYYKLVTSPSIRTQAAILIGREEEPDFSVQHSSSDSNESVPYKDVYESLFLQAGQQPYCYAGVVQFAHYHAVSVGLAPVYNENTFEHLDKYYPLPASNMTDVSAVVVGCAANFTAQYDPRFFQDLNRLLYDNPLDHGRGGLTVHSHVTRLSVHRASIQDVHVSDVAAVDHLLTTSRVTSYQLSGFVINKLEPVEFPTPWWETFVIVVGLMGVVACFGIASSKMIIRRRGYAKTDGYTPITG